MIATRFLLLSQGSFFSVKAARSIELSDSGRSPLHVYILRYHLVLLGGSLVHWRERGKEATRIPKWFAANVDPILINPSLLIGGVPGFSGESSLLEGNTPLSINWG